MTTAATDSVPSVEATPLRQEITRPMLTVFVIGDVLGAGIYALVGEVAGKVGGAIWTSFLLAGVLAAFTATAYAELVTKYPQAAGAALYANKAFKRPFVTFLIAFAVMCSGVASAATLATAFGGDYLSEFVTLPKILVGVVFLGVLALINFRGIKESVKLNLGLTAIELTGLLLVTAIGLVFILDGGGDPGRALEFKSGEAVPLAMLSGASLAFFALIGFEDSVNVAEETQEPSRIFPPALFLGLGIALTIYIVVTLVAGMAVPVEDLEASDGPLLEVVQLGPLAINTKVFSAIALFALTNGALINMIMASRLIYGMAQQGIVPRVMGSVHPERSHSLGGDHVRRRAGDGAARARRPGVAGRHHRAAAAVRVRDRERGGADPPPRARRARALARADGAAGVGRRRLHRADRAEGGRRRGHLRVRRRAAGARRRAVGYQPGADGAGRADRPRQAGRLRLSSPASRSG